MFHAVVNRARRYWRGLAREVTGLFGRMAARLPLDGVALRPASDHPAVTGRVKFTVDPEAPAARAS